MGRRILGAALAIVALTPDARASIGLYPTQPPPEPPYVAVEQSLIIWDRDKKTEHLIRELRFKNVRSELGFFVPVPSKPEIAKVETSPFVALRTGLPFESNEGFGGIGRLTNPGLGALGGGAGKSADIESAEPAPAPVEVLQQLPIGAFTAFVVAA